MDKLGIFNKALSVYNIDPLTEDDLKDTEGRPEIQILELFLNSAMEKVMRERNWTFLETRLDLGEDKGAEGGYRHSYSLPEGLFRITRADGVYRVVGTRLLTNGRPEAYGIMHELPDSGVPEDFCTVVAFALAYYSASKLSPGDTKTQIALDMYQRTLSMLVMNDVWDSMHENREVADGVGCYV